MRIREVIGQETVLKRRTFPPGEFRRNHVGDFVSAGDCEMRMFTARTMQPNTRGTAEFLTDSGLRACQVNVTLSLPGITFTNS
jgi:hypothetical protein